MRKKKQGPESAQPAARAVHATEVFQTVTDQSIGLSKREAAALASLKGQRAVGSTASSAEVAKIATADADALFAELDNGGAQ